VDALLDTVSPTQFEPVELGPEWLANTIGFEVRGRRESGQPADFDLMLMLAPSKYVGIQVKSGNVITLDDVTSLASNFKGTSGLPTYHQLNFFNSATESPTATTQRPWGRLDRQAKRSELMRRLTPERRATYERIRKLREDIGPLDFDVVEELRELRENG
jgi:hypothetical protein